MEEQILRMGPHTHRPRLTQSALAGRSFVRGDGGRMWACPRLPSKWPKEVVVTQPSLLATVQDLHDSSDTLHTAALGRGGTLRGRHTATTY
eukprot:5834142-Prymnesium_polylepis.1